MALARDVDEPRILHDALTYRGWNLIVTGHDARSDLHEAEQLASLIDGPTVPTRPLFRALAETERAGLRHARQRWTTLITRCERVGDTSTLALATTLYGGHLLYAGEHDAADRLAARGAELSRQVHNHAFVANAMSIRAFAAVLREDTDAADALVGPDMLTSARLGGPLAHVTARLTVAFVQHARGELAAADRSLTEIEPTLRATGYTSFIAAFEVLRAMLAHDHGDASEARARMRTAFELERGRARHAQFAAWLAQLEHDHGASDEAVTLAHQALTVALERGDVWGGTAALTLLAQTRHDDGDPVSATRLLAAADAARSRHGTHGGPFERIARDRLREALTADLGDEEFVAVWGEGRTLSLGDAAALVRRGRGERGRPSAGWDSLTPSELDVVAQVVAGASNPEIAERLFVSRNTVKSHLSNVYRKLGFNSRSQLASEAALRGLGATAP